MSADDAFGDLLSAIASHQEKVAAPYVGLSDEDLLRVYQRGIDLHTLMHLYMTESYLRSAGAVDSAAALSEFHVKWNREGSGMWAEITRRGLRHHIQILRYPDIRGGEHPNNHFDEPPARR